MKADLWGNTYISDRCLGCLYSREGKINLEIESFSQSDPCMTCNRVNTIISGPEYTDKFKQLQNKELRKIWSI